MYILDVLCIRPTKVVKSQLHETSPLNLSILYRKRGVNYPFTTPHTFVLRDNVNAFTIF